MRIIYISYAVCAISVNCWANASPQASVREIPHKNAGADSEVESSRINNYRFLDIEHKLKLLESDMTEVRRDELNYRLDRDLLKDSFNANLTKMNFLITAISLMFSVLGFLGLGKIKDVEKNYKDELKELALLRGEHQVSLSVFQQKQQELINGISELKAENQKQDIRLKILDMQEKATSNARSGLYYQALEYISLGLEFDQENELLLGLKVSCLNDLKRFEEAFVTTEKLVAITKNEGQISQMFNLAECSLLIKNTERFDQLMSTLETALSTPKNISLKEYLFALRAYIAGDLSGVAKHLNAMITAFETEPQAKIKNWSFNELMGFFEGEANSASKIAFNNMAALKKGSIDKDKMLKIIEEINISGKSKNG